MKKYLVNCYQRAPVSLDMKQFASHKDLCKYTTVVHKLRYCDNTKAYPHSTCDLHIPTQYENEALVLGGLAVTVMGIPCRWSFPNSPNHEGPLDNLFTWALLMQTR